MKTRFPVILHTDDGKAYGVTIPDIPGCFTAGDTLDEALALIQEAVETHLDEGDEIPTPSDPSAVMALPEAEGGILALVDIDLDFLDREPVRVNISVPRRRLDRIDAEAKRRGLTRSGFLVVAAEKAMDDSGAWESHDGSGSVSGGRRKTDQRKAS